MLILIEFCHICSIEKLCYDHICGQCLLERSIEWGVGV